MKSWYRVLSLLVSAILVVGLLPTSAFATAGDLLAVSSVLKSTTDQAQTNRSSLLSSNSESLNTSNTSVSSTSLYSSQIIDIEATTGNFAITNQNTLIGWGEIGLGDYSYENLFAPRVILDDVEKIRYVGGNHYAITNDGSLWGWGTSEYLGDGILEAHRLDAPVKIMEYVQEVGCAGECVFALKEDGSLWSWGRGYYGCLGNGSTEDKLTPVKILDNVSCIVNTGDDRAYAIGTNGALWAWGCNREDYPLGTGKPESSYSDRVLRPTKILDNIASVITSEGDSRFAISTNGDLFQWDSNIVADNTLYNECYTPKKVAENVVSAFAPPGEGMIYVVKTDGTLWTWKTHADYSNPEFLEQRKILDNICPDSVRNQYGAMYALSTDGNLWSWWKPSRDWSELQPKICMSNISKYWGAWKEKIYALGFDGTLWAWGDSTKYEPLGDGHTETRTIPVKILGDADECNLIFCWGGSDTIRTVYCLKSNGTLWGWGGNQYHPLVNEDNPYVNSLSPIKLFGVEDSQISLTEADEVVIPSQVWTGNAVEPKFNVVVRDTVLTEGVDYFLSYRNNIDEGVATVIATGIGCYCGEKSFTFKITKQPESANVLLFSYGFDDTYNFVNDRGITVPRSFFTRLFTDSYTNTLIGDAEEVSYDGACFGMVASAQMMASCLWPQVSSYSNNGKKADNVYGLGRGWASSESNLSVWDLVKYAFILQFDGGDLAKEWQSNMNDLDGLLKAVKDDADESKDTEPIAIGLHSNGGAHTVWAIGLERDDSERAVIRIYDPNDPGEDSERVLSLFKDGNGKCASWDYRFVDGSHWGSRENDPDSVELSWQTPANRLRDKLKNGSGESQSNAGFKNVLAIDKDSGAIVEIGGKKYSFSDLVMMGLFLGIVLSNGNEGQTSADLPDYYWLDADELTFSGFAKDSSFRISNNDAGMDVRVTADSEAKVRIGDKADSELTLSQSEGSRFSVDFYRNGNEGLDSLAVSGVGSNTVHAKTVGDYVEVSGVTELSAENEEGETTRKTGLDKSETYTVLPGGDNAAPVVLAGVKSVSMGAGHTALLMQDGSLWTCGWNSSGQLGDGTKEDRTEFVKVLDGVREVAASHGCHTVALKEDGSVWVCGRNDRGQLGDGFEGHSAQGGNYDGDRSTFVKVMDGARAVSTGDGHTAVIKNDGSLWLCGSNLGGCLGIGASGSRSTFVKVADDVSSVSLGLATTAFVKSDGTLWVCGFGGDGRLGTGDNTSKDTFAQVADHVSQVSCGGSSMAVIKDDGSLWACGICASYGYLGSSANEVRSRLTHVLDDVSSVSCGAFNVNISAIKSDGTLWNSGRNDYGQIGDGTKNDRYDFVKVMEDVSSASVGQDSISVITNSGSVYVWGRNANGELGLGSKTGVSTPQKLERFSSIMSEATSDISNASVSGIVDGVYTGMPIKQVFEVKLNGGTLQEGWDYTASYSRNIDAGSAVLNLKGKGRFSGEKSVAFQIKPASISDAQIEGISDSVYSGNACTQTVVVKVNGSIIQEGNDYSVAYKDNVNAGISTVTITGKGNYTGAKSATFKINAADISGASITGLSDKTYTGKPLTQSPTVKLAGATLKSGTDYAVSYKNNVNIGTATVTITGKGNYTGAKSATFKINAAPSTSKTDLSKAIITGLKAKTYTGKALTQTLVVKVGSKTLKSGTDYAVGYKNNKNAGTAIVTVTGKGAYTGTKSATFKINKAKQPMTAKAVNKTAKAKTLKKKAVTLTKTVTVKKKQGTLAYKNVSAQKAAKKFKVNAKKGTITIPKNTKKGTYQVKIKVTAKGNANYASGNKTVTVRVAVK